jgi:cation diffusion facilitator family transporter
MILHSRLLHDPLLVIFASAASAASAAYESYLKLISDRGTTNLYVGMGAAVIGMAGNFAVSRYKKHVARQIHSVTMEAEANHSWLDMISSLGALIGLVGVAIGYRWADPIAGFLVTLFILHVGWEVTSEILHHPMDGVEPEHLEAARHAASSVPEVRDVAVRVRWMGRSLTLEVEGQLPGEASLGRAEEIGRGSKPRCAARLRKCGTSAGFRVSMLVWASVRQLGRRQ